MYFSLLQTINSCVEASNIWMNVNTASSLWGTSIIYRTWSQRPRTTVIAPAGNISGYLLAFSHIYIFKYARLSGETCIFSVIQAWKICFFLQSMFYVYEWRFTSSSNVSLYGPINVLTFEQIQVKCIIPVIHNELVWHSWATSRFYLLLAVG